MGKVRGHDPVVIEEINGLWNRGDPETCPTDHLLIADNIQFIHSGVRTRNAIEPYLVPPIYSVQPGNVFDLRRLSRIYSYITQTSQTLIGMERKHLPGQPVDSHFYHIRKSDPTEVTEIGMISDVDDFAAITIADRVYISPIKYNLDPAGNVIALGKPGESVYVYSGTGQMRKAAGSAPSNASGTPSDGGKKPLIAYNAEKDGKVTAGHHAFSVAFVNAGGEGNIHMSLRPAVDAPGGKMVRLDNIPIGPAGTTGRIIAMTKAVVAFAPGQDNKMYRVIGIPDNTTTSFLIDIADSELETNGEYIPGGGGAAPPIEAMFLAQLPEAGFADLGMHLFGVVYEMDTGYLSAPGPEFFPLQTLVDGTKKITAINIPLGPAGTVRRHLVATHMIPDFYAGDQKAYQFFFIPKAVLENNTATTLDFNFYDSDLVSDASHLTDNYSTIPACVAFCQYHSRLVMVGFSDYPLKLDGITPDTSKGDNRSVALLSAPGEPEAVSKIDGVIVTPRDGYPLQNCEQFRDILYLFKMNRTYAYSDNNDEPVTWSEEVLDQGVGAPHNGIAQVLDSGGVNIDYLLIAHYSGLLLFNGTYARPELSWKIEDMWIGQGRQNFVRLQIVNDSIGKKIWILPANNFDRILYNVDYGNGLDPKGIRWSRWTFNSPVTSIAMINTDQLAMSMWQSVITTADEPPPFYLVRPERVVVDGRVVWEDTQDPFPPLPPPSSGANVIEGGIMFGNRSNPNLKHDVYYNTLSEKIGLPIQGRIRTAYMGD